MNLEEAAEHPEAIGRPLPAFEAAILDEAMKPVADGETGQLALRGPGMFAGYLSPPRRRDEVLREGWFMTGDLAHRDERGVIAIDGRSKSVIHVAGHKVFPEEVAAVLDQHPAVLRSRVTSDRIPNWAKPSMPRCNCARASPAVAAEDILAFCRHRLSNHKVPASLDLVTELDPDSQRKGAPRMRILLVKPKPRLKTILKLQPIVLMEPLELGYVAAAVPPGHDVRVLDLRLSRWPDCQFARALKRLPARHRWPVRLHARVHKGQGAGAQWCGGCGLQARIVVGGHHATVLPEDYNLDCFDAIVRGEGCAPFAPSSRRPPAAGISAASKT